MRDAFIARFDAAGELDETVQWGGSASDFVLSTSTWRGSVYAAGYTETAEHSRDALLARWSFW